MIQTKKVSNRKKLHFKSIPEAIAYAEKLVDAESKGELEQLGNWTLGQSLGHLAAWVDIAFNGPPPVKMSKTALWVARLFRQIVIYKGMPAGSKFPGAPEGTYGTEVMSTSNGLVRFQSNFIRLLTECPTKPNALFGRLTHDEWINLNLRHAELHLSFFRNEANK